ncbi:MAG TPA: helix-turn-helix domain-containing protein [Dehalococcoidia bacterium]|nr:helix-turn-helix domain-containing protein [Dehalococcoidia bacterium]
MAGHDANVLRDRILQAALGMFALKGFDDTSMEDIALAIGCSKGGLYYHFRDKEQLFASVVERCRDARTLQERRVLTEAWALASRSERIRQAILAADPGRNAPSLLDATLARGWMVREQLNDEPFRPAALAMLLHSQPTEASETSPGTEQESQEEEETQDARSQA